MKRNLTLTLGILCAMATVATIATAQPVQPTNPGTITTEIKGTPYLDESYVDGTILFATNTRKAPLRYNAYKDLIEFKSEGQARVIDASTTIKRVSLGESTLVVEKYRDNKDVLKYGFFTLVDSGKVTFYSKKSVKLNPALKGRALDGGDQPAEYRRLADEFYFKFEGGEMTEVKSIKSMIAAFPDKQDELTAFAKKEKISPRDEEELKKLFAYYNSL